MKKLYLLLSMLLGFCSTDPLFAQATPWVSFSYDDPALPPTGAGGAQIMSSAIDNNGNSYVGYYLQNNVSISNQIFQVIDSSVNCLIVKYNLNGEIVWTKHLAPEQGRIVQIADLKVDESGNLYATGSFWGSVAIDGDTLQNYLNAGAGANWDYFLAKWDSDGVLQWAVNAGGNGGKNPWSIAVSNTGEIYLGGSYNGEYGTTDFGPFSFTTTIDDLFSIGFLAKYSPPGEIQWVHSFTHTEDYTESDVREVFVDLNNNLYLYGRSTQQPFAGVGPSIYSFGGLSFSSGHGRYLIKCNSSGQPIYHKNLNAGSSSLYNDNFVVDAAGYSYITGFYWDSVDVGGITLPPANSGGGSATYLAKYDPLGTLVWVQKMEAANAPNNYLTNYGIDVDEVGNVYMVGGFHGTIQIGFQQLQSSLNVSSVIASFDANTGQPVWAKAITNQQHSVHCRVNVSSTGQVLLSGGFLFGPISFGSTQLTGHGPGSSNQAFISRLMLDYNTITGKVFLDVNANSIQDSLETGFPGNTVVAVTPGQYGFVTTGNGSFSAVTDIGNYTVSLANPPVHYNLVPLGPTAASFTNYGNIATGYDFALQPIPNQQDVEAMVTPFTPARPGFTTKYRLTYKNVGTTAISAGSVSFNINSLHSLDSCSQVATVAGNTLTWTYANLQPTETRNIDVYLTLSATAPLNDTLQFTSTVEPIVGDLTPINNSANLEQVIFGSYDPNEIEVNYQQISSLQVQSGQWLEYIIRFQNMGTDTAFTVMLRDSLPAGLLNLGTIEMLSASNNYTWNLNADGIMTVLFTSIKLPHESINEPGSHGFIRFRVKPNTTLIAGDIIPNQAKIYFDYNPYIATNIASTEVKMLSRKGEEQFDSWQLFPNPAHDKLIVSAASVNDDVDLALINVLGQEVLKNRASATNGLIRHELNLQHLPNGIYVLRIKTNTGVISKSVIRQ